MWKITTLMFLFFTLIRASFASEPVIITLGIYYTFLPAEELVLDSGTAVKNISVIDFRRRLDKLFVDSQNNLNTQAFSRQNHIRFKINFLHYWNVSSFAKVSRNDGKVAFIGDNIFDAAFKLNHSIKSDIYVILLLPYLIDLADTKNDQILPQKTLSVGYHWRGTILLGNFLNEYGTRPNYIPVVFQHELGHWLNQSHANEDRCEKNDIMCSKTNSSSNILSQEYISALKKFYKSKIGQKLP